MYQNILNFYNNNFWGYGVFGKQTRYNPRTPEGLKAIKSNFDYAKSNVLNFAETLLTTGALEGIGLVARWATTPVEIGKGAEAVVTSSPLSSKVTKITTIPGEEMRIRNRIPGFLKSKYEGTKEGFNIYTQDKVKVLSNSLIKNAMKQLETIMNSKGWYKITHPNLDGVGFSNGKWVVSDLGAGNIGKDIYGRVRIIDSVVETFPEFMTAMEKKGGKLKKHSLSFKNNILDSNPNLDNMKNNYKTKKK